ncbi:MAG: YlxR family protein [Chloroflexi bacterium]|nr:YlxR family protein [Chloroflexota bacterium]
MAAPSNSRPRQRPRRTCVACRTERDKRDLVRIVRTPERDVVMDASGRLNGRGAYLCADGSCWTAALKKSALERALDVALPADLVDRLRAGDSVTTGEAAHGSQS